MRLRLLGLLLVAIAPVVVVGACSHEVALTDWISQADAVCASAQASADENPIPASPLPGEELRVTAKRSRAELVELRKLDKTEEKSSAVSEYLLTLDHRADELENYAEKLDKTPAQDAPPSRVNLEELTTQAYTQSVALGLTSCNGGVDFTIDTTTTTLYVPNPDSTTPVVTGIGGQPEGQDTTEDKPGVVPSP